jgi:predicted XRE-type DNA-binding protein
MKTSAYKVRNSGKQIETDKARRADVLKISFTIAENQLQNQVIKYYVQVIDSKNNVLGDKKIIDFGADTLTYSFMTTVKYENKTVQVTENLPGKEKEPIL